MINPYLGTEINNRYYRYVSDSFKVSRDFKNGIKKSQNDRVVSGLQGLSKKSFTISIELANEYNVNVGTSFVGSTFWPGISRLADLETSLGGKGVSMPVTFLTPYGATFTVIPTGTLDIQQFNPSNPGSSGMEFIVSLTLEEI